MKRAICLFLLLIGTRIAQAADSYLLNLSTSPIDWFNAANGRLDLRVSPQWSVGAAFFDIDRVIKTVMVRDLSVGAYLNYAFSGASANSWFADLGVFYGDVYASVTDASGVLDQVRCPGFTERAMLGYQWFTGRFNVSASGGIEWNSAGHAPIRDPNGVEAGVIPLIPVHGELEISLGFSLF